MLISLAALLLLYDVSNKTSFDNTRAWLGEINEYAQEDVVIMLLGNKADMNQDRVIRYEDGERLAKVRPSSIYLKFTLMDLIRMNSVLQEYNVVFMETSAKTGMNVELAFMAIARLISSEQKTVFLLQAELPRHILN